MAAGDKEEVLFLLMGSVADLRKTTDQQFVNAALGSFKAPLLKILIKFNQN